MMAVSPTQSVYDTVSLPLGDTTFIRLISIRASGVSDASSRIVCEFHLLDLENGSLYAFNTISLQSQQVQYRALSYTWGDAASLEIIELDGKPLTVRRNLWTFLDRARRDHFEGYLWIDALCIDQSTISERNHQVAMMGNIYSRAEGVIVWLGFVPRRVEDAMREVCDQQLVNKHRPVLSKKCGKGVEDFEKLAYWSRAWIVQEYVLAKTIDIWLGRFRMEGEQLSWLHRIVQAQHFPWRDPVSKPRPRTLPVIWSIISSRQERSNTRKSVDDEALSDPEFEFPTLLSQFGPNLRSADPRDRVYALLSLLSPDGRRKLSIVPDYSKTASELFALIMDSFWRNSVLYDDVNVLRQNLQLRHDDPVVKTAREKVEVYYFRT